MVLLINLHTHFMCVSSGFMTRSARWSASQPDGTVGLGSCRLVDCWVMPAAIIFCRVSTAKQQQRNEANLPAQEKRCQDWCKANSLPVLRVFVAEGESAWETTRPVFEEALHFAQLNKGKVSHFVVQDVSRFSRNMETQAIAMARLKKIGVTFISCDEPSIDTSPVGRLMAGILGSMAEFYSTAYLPA